MFKNQLQNDYVQMEKKNNNNCLLLVQYMVTKLLMDFSSLEYKTSVKGMVDRYPKIFTDL